jgi:glutaminyl-tRNA synthetase
VQATYVPESRSGSDTSGLAVKGVVHWVSVAHAVQMEARLYDRLFKIEDTSEMEGDFKDYLNPESLNVKTVYAEPSLAQAKPGEKFQFLRMGYFTPDADSSDGRLIFNRTVTLRDTWAKSQ